MKEKLEKQYLNVKKSTLVDIANKIREKTGSTDLIKVKDYLDHIQHQLNQEYRRLFCW